MVWNGVSRFSVGQKVFAKTSKKSFQIGLIHKVNNKKDQCFVHLENKSKIWVAFEDLHVHNKYRGNCKRKEEEIVCCLCRGASSEHPNEIVLCDGCGQGFHQLCHNPVIEDDALMLDTPWSCRLCLHDVSTQSVAKRRLRHSAPPSPAPSVDDAPLKETDNRRAVKATRKGGRVRKREVEEQDEEEEADIPEESAGKISSHCLKCPESQMDLFQSCSSCGDYERWFDKMLMCKRCRKWFHCREYVPVLLDFRSLVLSLGCIWGMPRPFFCGNRFFMFVCKSCNHGHQLLRSLPLTWSHLAHLAMFNLCIDDYHRFHDIDEKIMPWINQNWKHLHVSQEYSRCNLDKRKEKLLESLHSNSTTFRNGMEVKKRFSWWGLREFCAPPRPYFCVPTKSALTERMADSLQVSYLPGGIIQRSIRQQFFKRKAPERDPSSKPPTKRRKVENENQESKVEEAIEPSPSPSSRPSSPVPLEDVEAFTISDRVPRRSDFDGVPHPFLTPLECSEQLQKHEARISAMQQQIFGIDFENKLNGFSAPAAHSKKRARNPVQQHFDITACRSLKNGTKQYLLEWSFCHSWYSCSSVAEYCNRSFAPSLPSHNVSKFHCGKVLVSDTGGKRRFSTFGKSHSEDTVPIERLVMSMGSHLMNGKTPTNDSPASGRRSQVAQLANEQLYAISNALVQKLYAYGIKLKFGMLKLEHLSLLCQVEGQ
ncbi:hypothetical protein CAPTEDRAFT_187445 [Capitella teleta]|uniref:PHD-type domain-containing protein n=1 Tax=Capitella teleta TaxID=283909 RepID=R7VL49_CAPTE|nr:hypothetical protein CAPTEDRAFT_187445 [Capitella teleta]|eukprot:ELU17305.1 hypothetical protein CAPTEDRAFT_187445 [Capitella teleta]